MTCGLANKVSSTLFQTIILILINVILILILVMIIGISVKLHVENVDTRITFVEDDNKTSTIDSKANNHGSKSSHCIGTCDFTFTSDQ